MKRLTVTIFGEDAAALQTNLYHAAANFANDHAIMVADAVRKHHGNDGPAIGRWTVEDIDTVGSTTPRKQFDSHLGVNARNVCSLCGAETVRCYSFASGIFWTHVDGFNPAINDHAPEVTS